MKTSRHRPAHSALCPAETRGDPQGSFALSSWKGRPWRSYAACTQAAAGTSASCFAGWSCQGQLPPEAAPKVAAQEEQHLETAASTTRPCGVPLRPALPLCGSRCLSWAGARIGLTSPHGSRRQLRAFEEDTPTFFLSLGWSRTQGNAPGHCWGGGSSV